MRAAAASHLPSRLRPLLVPGVVTAVMFATLVGLGLWQLHRLAWKEGVLADIARAEQSPPVPLTGHPLPFAKVSAAGHMRGDVHALYGADVRDEPGGSVMGAQLIEPLERPGQDPVLVERGWIADGAPLPPPGDTVVGYVRAPDAPGLESRLLLKSGFFSSALMSELFLGMVALSVTVGLPWRTHDARIAHGLGVFSLLDLAIEAVHTVHGGAGALNVQDVLTSARMIVYLGCLVYWIVTLWQEAPEPRDLPLKLIAELRLLNARVAYDLGTLRKWKKP